MPILHALKSLIWIILLATVVGSSSAQAQADRTFSPIIVDKQSPSTFYLVGEIDGRTAFNFKRAVSKYGAPSEFVLTSGGGLVHEALLLALEVREIGLRTTVNDYCLSACFYVFMAGAERQVFGDLGVHQISSESGNLQSGQIAIGDIVDVLSQLGVSPEIIVLMLQTPPDQMHIFSPDELSSLGLVGRQRSSPTVSTPVSPAQNSERLVASAIEFVATHNRLWSQTNQLALDAIARTYANSVRFYGNDWSRAEVMSDKTSFANRWPTRDYNFRPSFDASFCNTSASCIIIGEVDWYAHSSERSATSRGTAEVEITLSYQNGQFLIVGETGKVISRR